MNIRLLVSIFSLVVASEASQELDPAVTLHPLQKDEVKYRMEVDKDSYPVYFAASSLLGLLHHCEFTDFIETYHVRANVQETTHHLARDAWVLGFLNLLLIYNVPFIDERTRDRAVMLLSAKTLFALSWECGFTDIDNIIASGLASEFSFLFILTPLISFILYAYSVTRN